MHASIDSHQPPPMMWIANLLALAALVAALDEQVGTVVGAFEVRKRPLVFWFLGDNGPEVPARCPLHAIDVMCHRGVHTGWNRRVGVPFPRRQADRV